MSVGFLVIGVIIACYLAWRGIKNHGFYVAGEKVSTGVVVAAGLVIVVAWSLFAAMQLGFIPDHAP